MSIDSGLRERAVRPTGPRISARRRQEAGKRRWRAALVCYALVQVTLLGLAAALPYPAGGAATLLLLVVGAGTLIVCVARLRSSPRAGWWLVAASSLSLLAGGVVDGVQGSIILVSAPSIAFRAASLALLAAGLAVLGRRRGADGERADVMDAAMAAAGLLLVEWLFVTDPVAISGNPLEITAAAAISIGGVLVFMAGVKLVLSGGLRDRTIALLALAVCVRVAATVGLLLPAAHTTSLSTNRPNTLLMAAAVGILGAAALSLPDAGAWRVFVGRGTDLSAGRAVLFMGLAIVVPAVLAFELVNRPSSMHVTPAGVGVPTAAAATVLLLLVTRLVLTARVSQRRALELTHRSTALMEAVAEQEALQRQLAYRAMHDPLTDLPNRAVLTERLEWALSGAGSREILAVLLMDLDGFKDINDTFGHPVGDEILVDVSRRLLVAAPADAVVSRFGGDEFAVLVEAVPGQPEALAQAEQIIEAVRRPFVIEDQPMLLSISIGLLTIGPGQRSITPTEALRDADFALYAAKEAGKDRVVPFNTRLRDYQLERAHISSRLRHALDHGDLLNHYQPIINLTTGDVVGVEALARWRTPDGDMISPAQFIPVAEETGLINAIGARVLRQACADAREWHREYGIFVAVNVSGRQVDDPGFADGVITVLADCGLPPNSLVLELTESSLIGGVPHQQGPRQLERLRQSGIRIAIDDFGTGYSSLSYVSRIPMDIVKLDKSFTENRTDPAVARKGWAFTGAILEALANLGLKVVAEGVETPAQAKALADLKCPFAQGFLYSRPVTAADISPMLHTHVSPML